MLTCAKCSRANPADATYCYFDGMLLARGRANGGPLRAGTLTFPREFVFASGRRCRSFDELSLACVEEPAAARDMLRAGYLESFLGGIGRNDLAAIARQAGQFPDPARGVDMLLEHLPSQVVAPPRLQVEPLSINLGQLPAGKDHRFSIRIANLGMRLLYGTLVVDETPWLAIGSGPGVPEKGFDCEHELEISLLVVGKKLKANKNPLLGKIAVESNGGSVEVSVKVEVPIKPFSLGVLSGARTQRQLAEQAYKNAKDAAPLFESGAVARWYAENNWTYPVQGPTATGIGALQQFLEACGLTTPPKVQLETAQLKLVGAVGENIKGEVRLKALEKRPIFAYASSDQPWLKVLPAVLSGVSARIQVEVESAPASVGSQPHTARLSIISNGRQRFTVPVILEITTQPALPALPARAIVPPTARAPRQSPASAQVPEVLPADEIASGNGKPRRESLPAWAHVFPAALLAFILMSLLLVDAFRSRSSVARGSPDLPLVALADENDDRVYLIIGAAEVDPHRFGISVPGEKRGAVKQLTFDPFGKTNNAIVRIDGQDWIYGMNGEPGPGQRSRRRLDEVEPGRTWRSVWQFPDNIIATQEVSIRRSDQTGRFETCLVRYTLRNADSVGHKVGLRFMLDTFIGDNDGVPFTIPGQPGLCDTYQQFLTPDQIPDFIQALERPDLKNPGTVANLTLRVADKDGRIEPPNRVQLSAWPNQALAIPGAQGSMTRWEVPLAPIHTLSSQPDSAVIMYWDPRYLEPGETRELAFAYGLGKVSSTGRGAGELAVTVAGSFRPGGEFTVTAYVANPQPNQQARLVLPAGLSIADGQGPDRPVKRSPVGAYSPVTWRVRADATGSHELSVQTGGLSQSERVNIRAKSFLD